MKIFGGLKLLGRDYICYMGVDGLPPDLVQVTLGYWLKQCALCTLPLLAKQLEK